MHAYLIWCVVSETFLYRTSHPSLNQSGFLLKRTLFCRNCHQILLARIVWKKWSHHTGPMAQMVIFGAISHLTRSTVQQIGALQGCELSDDLELGKDEVRAKGKSRQEGSEAKVPNDHEWCVFTCQELEEAKHVLYIYICMQYICHMCKSVFSWMESAQGAVSSCKNEIQNGFSEPLVLDFAVGIGPSSSSIHMFIEAWWLSRSFKDIQVKKKDTQKTWQQNKGTTYTPKI